MTEQAAMLEIRELTVKYSELRAVNSLSMHVAEGGRVAIIGPNGSGKSTLLKAIVGEERAASGEIIYLGRRVQSTRTVERARRGMIRTRQELGLFWSMTTWENVVCGWDNPGNRRSDGSRRPHRWSATGSAGRYDYVDQVLSWLDLQRWRDLVPSALPYGVRKRVELARAIAAKPRLLMLDEPVAGLNTVEKAEMVEQLQTLLGNLAISLVLVEHDMQTVSALCPEVVYAMVAGRVVCSGPFRDVIHHPQVVAAYFGSSREDTARSDSGAEPST